MSYQLTIRSKDYQDSFIIVDKSIYNKYRSHSLLVAHNGSYTAVKVVCPKTHKYLTLYKCIIDYDHYREAVIHKNGDKFDFRKDNLEVVNRGDLLRKKDSCNKVYNKYKGVHKKKSREGYPIYHVYVYANSDVENVYVGTTQTEKAGALMYDAACRLIFGNNACFQNIPNEIVKLEGGPLTNAKKIKKLIQKEGKKQNIA